MANKNYGATAAATTTPGGPKKRGRPAGWRKPAGTEAQPHSPPIPGLTTAVEFRRILANNPQLELELKTEIKRELLNDMQEVAALLGEIRADTKRSEHFAAQCETQIQNARGLLDYLGRGEGRAGGARA